LTLPDLTFRVVPQAEWPRVLPQALLAARDDAGLPRSGHVVLAECGGRVAGLIAAERVYCVSPLVVARPWLGTYLPKALARVISSMNTEGWREVLCTTSRHVELLAHAEGFVPVEGTMFRRG
jgi:hypothetical protein